MKSPFFQQFFDRILHYNRLVDDYKRAADVSPDAAMSYVNWGIELGSEGKLDEAIERFRQAAEIAPGRFEPYLNWGIALAKRNELAAAIEKFERATELEPGASNAYLLWGAALIELGQTEEAMEKYGKAIELNPENPEPHVNWGIVLSRIGQYAEAIQHFKLALALHGAQPQVFFLWGVVLAELGQYPEAIEKFQQTLRFLPKHADSWYFWSVVLNRMGHYDEALEKSKSAMALNDKKAEVYLNQGDILANLGRLDVAISNFRHAVTLDPNLAEAYLSWGVALSKSGAPDSPAESELKFRKAHQLNPELPHLHRHWGMAMLEQARYEEAVAELAQAHQREPEQVEILLNWAMALIKLGRMSEALERLMEAERRDRWNPQVNYLLGTHLMAEERYAEAVGYIEKALESRPDFEDAAINLSLIYCEMGETLEAVRRMRPVLRKSPESARVNFFYGTVLYRHGDLKEAVAKYQKAMALEPDYTAPRIGLAEVYLAQDNWEAARALLEPLDEEIPALFLRALGWMRQGEADPAAYGQAGALLDRILALDPGHFDARANRAYLMGRLESPERMNDEFARLVNGATSDQRAMVLFYWAKALERLGRLESSREKYEEARSIDPQGIEKLERVVF